MSAQPDIRTAPSASALAEAAARHIADRADEAVRARGRFNLAVSGGSTPTAMFAALTHQDLPWPEVHVFQVDERIAPLGDKDRNLGDLASNLLEQVPIPWRNVHQMPVDAADPAAAANEYAEVLAHECGGVLDLVHLGLGDDGHTASWPPGDPDVGTWTGDVAVTGTFNGRRRMTLTPPAVNRARQVLWLVTGADKAVALAGVRRGDAAFPGSRVTAPEQVLFADAAALGEEP
jgi:6-phosphogluconolactonase